MAFFMFGQGNELSLKEFFTNSNQLTVQFEICTDFKFNLIKSYFTGLKRSPKLIWFKHILLSYTI